MSTVDGPVAEARALEQLAERLHADHDLPADRVDEAIAEALAAFAGRPVRDFIPILVERRVREHLGLRRPSAAAGEGSS